MEFLTHAQAVDWCRGAGIVVDADGRLPRRHDSGRFSVRCALPPQSARLAWLAGWLVLAVPAADARLLLVTEWGVWPSSESWTLFDGLRRGYGEVRPLHEAPGHVASGTATDDLAAFVLVGLAFGWDLHLLGAPDHVRIIVSHDEWIECSSADAAQVEQIAARFDELGLSGLGPRAA